MSKIIVTCRISSPYCEVLDRDVHFLPIYFIMCIELLSYKISTTEDIKGIIYTKQEFKKSLFADDASFILDGSFKSFQTLIDILDNFSYISGLKLNAKKCQVLRIGSMSKSDIVYLKGRKFQWSSTEASSLAMTFCTNKDNIFRANLETKIKLFEKCLKQWQHRKLTLMGKITFIKIMPFQNLYMFFLLYLIRLKLL